MTDKATLGQNVPNMAEGLYLMDGIKGLLSLPQHSVDMPVSYTHLDVYKRQRQDKAHYRP